jgi:hypothetical protein
MELSIVINSYRNPSLLRLCIESIRKNIQGTEYEIIVADSATEEETEMMMREDYQKIKFFPFKRNVGLQALVKRGIEESKGKYILLLNADIIVTEKSVEKLLSFIKNDSGIGIAGPKLLNFNGTLQYSYFRFYKPITILYRRLPFKNIPFIKKHLDWFLMKDYNHETTREVDWLMGSALMISRKAFEKVGFMDSRFFMYMEDVDWCRRFWDNGFKVVFYPSSIMHHYHGKGSSRGGFVFSLFFNKLTWVHISSAIKYFVKYWGKPLPKHN